MLENTPNPMCFPMFQPSSPYQLELWLTIAWALVLSLMQSAFLFSRPSFLTIDLFFLWQSSLYIPIEHTFHFQ